MGPTTESATISLPQAATRRLLQGIVVVAALVVGVVFAPPAESGATDGCTATGCVVVTFDADAGEYLEGVAVDKYGNVFVSMNILGQVWKFAPDSDEPEVFGSIAGWSAANGDVLLGLAVDAPGNVYATGRSAGAAGVWKFDRKTGDETLLPDTAQIWIPNALSFDHQGNLYVTSHFSGLDATTGAALGAIWRINAEGTVEKWFESPELGGNGLLGGIVPIGANGIAYRQGTLYVANTEQFRVLAVPVQHDGTPGVVSTVATGLITPDGLALDVHGRIYVAAAFQSAVRRINLDGSLETIASGAADGLDGPSSLAFGTGKDAKQDLYVVNFDRTGTYSTGVGPALVRVEVGAPGMPLP